MPVAGDDVSWLGDRTKPACVETVEALRNDSGVHTLCHKVARAQEQLLTHVYTDLEQEPDLIALAKIGTSHNKPCARHVLYHRAALCFESGSPQNSCQTRHPHTHPNPYVTLILWDPLACLNVFLLCSEREVFCRRPFHLARKGVYSEPSRCGIPAGANDLRIQTEGVFSYTKQEGSMSEARQKSAGAWTRYY